VIDCLVGVIVGMIAVGTTWDGTLQIEPAPILASKTPGPTPQNAIAIQVEVDPEWPGWEGLKLVCPTTRYRGESSARGKDTSLRMAISGTIKRISQRKSLISYDLEIRFRDRAGVTRLSAAGSGVFAHGKPTNIITMAGKTVILTATLVERHAELQGERDRSVFEELAKKAPPNAGLPNRWINAGE